MVDEAAESLEVQSATPPERWTWFARRAPLVASAAVVLLACAMAVGVSAFLYERYELAARPPAPHAAAAVPASTATPAVDRALPSQAAYTILVGAYPLADPRSATDIRSTTEWLEASGLHVYYAPIDSASGGRWQRVLAGAYADDAPARADVERLRAAAPSIDAQVVAANAAGGPGAAPAAAVTGRRDLISCFVGRE